MKIKILLFLTLVCTTPIYSQLFEAWITAYNGPGNFSDFGRSVAHDDSGNVYVTGHGLNPVTFYDIVTIKYNSAGIEQWRKSYNGPGNDVDYAVAMQTDQFQNVYVIGYTFNPGSQYDYVVLKYNGDSNLEWSRVFNGTANGIDLARGLFIDNAGSVYVTGHSYSGTSFSYDYATVKYSWDGDFEWSVRYNGPLNSVDGANAVYVDGAFNVYVTGQSTGDGTSYDMATIKYNSAGDQLWAIRYNGSANDIDAGLLISSKESGSVVVSGYSRGVGSSYDFLTVKYDEAGNELWNKRFDGPLNKEDIPQAMIIDNSGNIHITGLSDVDVVGLYTNYATLKYNSAGDFQWAAYYNGPANGVDSATSIALDDTGNVFVTGKSQGSGTGFDYATIKYTPTGIQDKVARYNGSGNSTDGAHSVSVDRGGNVYVTGSSISGSGNEDYITLRYSYISSINDPGNYLSQTYKLNQNYPNPFNPNTIIEYELSPGYSNQFIQINIFDISGKKVASLVNQKQSYGGYSVQFDGSNFSSGIYLYNLVADGIIMDTKKMILMK